ncbi:MAG: hypothetical protein S4CHLAM2_04000 [Chlamydiales bacterium]|nr:hypothetical protein [Chlamydiales bacterium]
MLLTLMFKCAPSEERLRSLKERYPIVLPGDPLPKRKVAVCLTFDDAFYDFYHSVFPILKKLQIRALVGVASRYALKKTDVCPEERLSVPPALAMQDGFFDKKATYCTWEELSEMVQSGFVEIASHSYMLCNLTFDFVDLNREVVTSKKMIEANLSQPVSSFIYPFGKTNPGLHDYVAEHYPYAFQISSALNWGWGNGKKPLNRIAADHLAPFSTFKLLKYACTTMTTENAKKGRAKQYER